MLTLLNRILFAHGTVVDLACHHSQGQAGFVYSLLYFMYQKAQSKTPIKSACF